MFSRSASKELIGFSLFREAVQVDSLRKFAKEILTNGRPRRGAWRALVEEVLTELGGEASLPEIYHAVAPRRVSQSIWWKEKIRQQLQLIAIRVQRGRWRLSAT
jgi:adenine-specific DNA-methyltransferase